MLTPYQRYDRASAVRRPGSIPARRVAIAVVHSGERRIGVLLLAIERHFGLTQARLIGTSIANGDWFPCEPAIAASLTPEQTMALLREIAKAAGGIDLIRFYNQPAHWQGVPNPLLPLSRSPAPNNLYFADIIRRRRALYRPQHFCQAAQQYQTWHAPARGELSGTMSLRRAETADELDRQHQAFLAQRAERFAEMGVENIFASREFVRFFKTLAAAGFGEPRPALTFHALYAGDQIVATSVGTYLSGDALLPVHQLDGQPRRKVSLTGLLLAELLDELVAGGITSIDMGTGDFDYKIEWTVPQPLFHSVIPADSAGPNQGATLYWVQRKRLIKQTPVLWAAAQVQVVRLAAYRVRHRK